MKVLTRAAAAAIAAIALTSGAAATDLYVYETPTPVIETTPVYDEAGFNWNGFYAGAIVSYDNLSGSGAFGFGKAVGVNFTAGNILYGVELNLRQVNSTPTIMDGSGQTRIGLLVDDNLLVYKLFGVGYFNDGGGSYDLYVKAGGGVEYALGKHFTVRGQYNADFVAGVCCAHEAQLGVLWHLN